MSGRIDLHIHSENSSDGDLPPSEIIRLAQEHKLCAISISDHDTVAAYPEAVQMGKEVGVEVIPSLELTTLYDGREFHLLLPFLDWRSQVLDRLITQGRKRRILEAQERVSKLKELGFGISWQEVEQESAPFPPLGVTIAQVLLRKNQGSQNPVFKEYRQKEKAGLAPYHFYADYFAEGKPAFVPRRNLDLQEVLEIVPQTGGVPVLAHPGASFQRVTADELRLLKSSGLKGLEVYTSYHDDTQTRFYLDLAERLGLIPTAGSDFHGAIKPHIPFASLRAGGYWMIEELRKRRN